MYHALLPKTDYRDKGRGYDRRLACLAILLEVTRFARDEIINLAPLGTNS